MERKPRRVNTWSVWTIFLPLSIHRWLKSVASICFQIFMKGSYLDKVWVHCQITLKILQNMLRTNFENFTAGVCSSSPTDPTVNKKNIQLQLYLCLSRWKYHFWSFVFPDKPSRLAFSSWTSIEQANGNQ